MGNIRTYKRFLLEKTNSYLKDRIETFNSNIDIKGIPDSLKELSDILHTEKLVIPSVKKIKFIGIDFIFHMSYGDYYNTGIDIMDLIEGKSTINMNLTVPKNYDSDFINSMFIHELRHCLDFLDENLNAETSSFLIDINRHKFNFGYYYQFMKLIYISLEHELVAMNNQIYPYLKFKNLSKEDSFNVLKSSFIWKFLDDLKTFNVDKFLMNDNLIDITNLFIEQCLLDNSYRITNSDDLKEFYTTWNEFFIKTSDEWKNNMLIEVNKLYEKKLIENFDTDIVKKILSNIWKSIK